MNKNRVFNNLNYVINAFTITKKSKNFSSKSKFIFRFNLIKINNLIYKLNKLFIYVIFTLYKIFNLFFIDEILYKLIKYINKYTTKYALKKNKFFARK